MNKNKRRFGNITPGTKPNSPAQQTMHRMKAMRSPTPQGMSRADFLRNAGIVAGGVVASAVGMGNVAKAQAPPTPQLPPTPPMSPDKSKFMNRKINDGSKQYMISINPDFQESDVLSIDPNAKVIAIWREAELAVVRSKDPDFESIVDNGANSNINWAMQDFEIPREKIPTSQMNFDYQGARNALSMSNSKPAPDYYGWYGMNMEWMHYAMGSAIPISVPTFYPFVGATDQTPEWQLCEMKSNGQMVGSTLPDPAEDPSLYVYDGKGVKIAFSEGGMPCMARYGYYLTTIWYPIQNPWLDPNLPIQDNSELPNYNPEYVDWAFDYLYDTFENKLYLIPPYGEADEWSVDTSGNIILLAGGNWKDHYTYDFEKNKHNPSTWKYIGTNNFDFYLADLLYSAVLQSADGYMANWIGISLHPALDWYDGNPKHGGMMPIFTGINAKDYVDELPADDIIGDGDERRASDNFNYFEDYYAMLEARVADPTVPPEFQKQAVLELGQLPHPGTVTWTDDLEYPHTVIIGKVNGVVRIIIDKFLGQFEAYPHATPCLGGLASRYWKNSTEIPGVVSEAIRGLVPRATFYCYGSTRFHESLNVISGYLLQWQRAIKDEVDILSNSWILPLYPPLYPDDDLAKLASLLYTTLTELESKGILVVAGAGNHGIDLGTEKPNGEILVPAEIPNVITVSGTGPRDYVPLPVYGVGVNGKSLDLYGQQLDINNWLPKPGSSKPKKGREYNLDRPGSSPELNVITNFGTVIDFAAPFGGVGSSGILSLIPFAFLTDFNSTSRAVFSAGTSISAPLACGVAALAIESYMKANNNDKPNISTLINILIKSADDLVGPATEDWTEYRYVGHMMPLVFENYDPDRPCDLPGTDMFYGFGRVNSFNAIQEAKNSKNKCRDGVDVKKKCRQEYKIRAQK